MHPFNRSLNEYYVLRASYVTDSVEDPGDKVGFVFVF